MNKKSEYHQYHAAKYHNVSKEEFEKQLEFCKNYRLYGINAKYDDFRNDCLNNRHMTPYEFTKVYPSVGYYYYIVKITKAFLSYKDSGGKDGKWIHLYYNLDNPEGGELTRSKDGGEAYRGLQRFAHIPSLEGGFGYRTVDRKGQSDKVEWSVKNIMPTPYSKEIDGEYHKVYYYDKHRAFLEGCKGKFPDTLNAYYMDTIKEGQVGFNADGIPNYNVGENCLYVFDLIEIPGLQKWADKMEKKILEAKEDPVNNAQLIFDLKHEYTDAIGMMCRHNPFVHNVIVDNCMRIMDSVIDENTLHSVTDSIISTVERKDLKLGIHTGEFEQDYIDKDLYFKKTDAGYQLYYKEGDEYKLLKASERGTSTIDEKVELREENKLALDDILEESSLCRIPSERDKEAHEWRIEKYKFQHMWKSIRKEYELINKLEARDSAFNELVSIEWNEFFIKRKDSSVESIRKELLDWQETVDKLNLAWKPNLIEDYNSYIESEIHRVEEKIKMEEFCIRWNSKEEYLKTDPDYIERHEGYIEEYKNEIDKYRRMIIHE